MTYTGVRCGAHLSEFDIQRKSGGDGEKGIVFRFASVPQPCGDRRNYVAAPLLAQCMR